jgi:simple sugar transport system permease protein
MVRFWSVDGGSAPALPLLFAAIGEVYAERSGVINLGIEGIMLVGHCRLVDWAATGSSPGIFVALLVGSAMGRSWHHDGFYEPTKWSSIAMLLIGSGLSIYSYRVIYGAQACAPCAWNPCHPH